MTVHNKPASPTNSKLSNSLNAIPDPITNHELNTETKPVIQCVRLAWDLCNMTLQLLLS